MKKILIYSLFTFISITSFSQLNYNSYMNEVGKWNSYNKTYTWSEVNYSNIKIVMDKEVIRVFDEVDSRYTITKSYDKVSGYSDDKVPKKFDQYTFDAYDEKYRKVKLLFLKYKDAQSLMLVIYDNVCFRYYIEETQTGLDRY